MLIITGLPRSGTTFLNNLFASGVFGNQYYGHHSNSMGGIGTNPLHLCESQMIGIMFRSGIRLETPLSMIGRYWRNTINDYEKIIVYKHPQILLQYPLAQQQGWRAKYIVCNRDYVPWRESFINVSGHIGIHVDSTDSHYEKYWPGGVWRNPEDWDKRMELLYFMFQEKMAGINKNDIFVYSSDEEHLTQEIIKLIIRFDNKHGTEQEIYNKAKKIINQYWRKPI